MKIGSILENQNFEKRIAITPDIVKKYSSLGFEVLLSKDYGIHLGFDNDDYISQGANIFENDKEEIKIVLKYKSFVGEDNLMLVFNISKKADLLVRCFDIKDEFLGEYNLGNIF